MKKGGITVAGSLIADIIYAIDTYPKIGRLTQIREQIQHVGGSCNLILDLAKLDPHLPVKVSGIVGNDSYGEFILKTCSQYPNVSTENVTVEGNSSITIVMDAMLEKQRTFFYNPVASDKYSEEYINWEQVEADIFHLEYLLLMKEMDSADEEYGTKSAKVLAFAQKRGMKTSIDVVSEDSERYKEVVIPALKYTDYCVVNEIEAEGITGLKIQEEQCIIEENVWKATASIRELGVSTWVVIHTPSCGYALDCKSGERILLPSVKLPPGYIKGTTGAGDAYCSGILYGAYQNKSLEESLHIANACAIKSLGGISGTQAMTTYEDTMIHYQRCREKEGKE